MEKSNNEVLKITRTFNAPKQEVWKAWIDAEIVKQWWGPKSYTSPFVTIDFREGGKYLYCMRSPEGKDYWSTGKYKEIVPFEKIVLSDSFADEKGNVVPVSYYGMESDLPLELEIELIFEEEDGRTRFTLRHKGFPSKRDHDDVRQGWNESLDKLEQVLQTQYA